MNIRIYISLLALVLSLHGNAQNFIGMHKTEIVMVMKETQKDFKLNTDVVNKKYNYLKFEDRINEQTVLYFLDEEDNCTYIRFMSDYSNYNSVLDSLNTKYTRKNDNTWNYTDKGSIYVIYLEKGEWFFTVNTKKKKKKSIFKNWRSLWKQLNY